MPREPDASTALACQPPAEAQASTGIEPKLMADALHAVMESDRTVYTRNVVNRLAKEQQVIKASEHWKDEPALPAPRPDVPHGRGDGRREGRGLHATRLLSMWPINKQNTPRTDVEIDRAPVRRRRTRARTSTPRRTLGGQKYFTAVYADTAVAPACVSCHNEHKDTPQAPTSTLGDVMGGVVLRIPVGS